MYSAPGRLKIAWRGNGAVKLCGRASGAGCCWELLPSLPAVLVWSNHVISLGCTILSPWHWEPGACVLMAQGLPSVQYLNQQQ